MNKQETFDKILDALTDEAVSIVDSTPDKDIPEERPVEFSEDLEQKIQRIFDDERRRVRRHGRRRYVRRICICAAVITALLAAAVMSVGALRNAVIEMIFNTTDVGTDINFVEAPAPDEPVDPESKAGFGYLPEGFVLVKEDVKSRMENYMYENGEQYFYVGITQITDGGSTTIDTENAEIEYMTINGWQAIYSEKPEVQILFWADDAYSYCISGNIGRDEIVQIAQNLKK